MSGNILTTWFKPLTEQMAATARLMVGVPDYDAYVNHMRVRHPEQSPLDYTSFFRARQEARYGGAQSRCC
jgi:uncharacterized short protein YbdD (DUF466 family)